MKNLFSMLYGLALLPAPFFLFFSGFTVDDPTQGIYGELIYWGILTYPILIIAAIFLGRKFSLWWFILGAPQVLFVLYFLIQLALA